MIGVGNPGPQRGWLFLLLGIWRGFTPSLTLGAAALGGGSDGSADHDLGVGCCRSNGVASTNQKTPRNRSSGLKHCRVSRLVYYSLSRLWRLSNPPPSLLIQKFVNAFPSRGVRQDSFSPRMSSMTPSPPRYVLVCPCYPREASAITPFYHLRGEGRRGPPKNIHFFQLRCKRE